MYVCIPILPSTVSAVETLLERIANLGGVSQYSVVLVSGGQVDLAPCHKLASAAFQGVSVFPVNIPDNYPLPVNILFARTAQHMATLGSAYLYLEPDSHPTGPTWLNDLVASYRETGHRFMGKLVSMPEPNPRNELYMLPTGIYPRDFFATSNLLRQMSPTVPANQFLNGEVVYAGKAHDSSLIAFGWSAEKQGIAALLLNSQNIGGHFNSEGELIAAQANPAGIQKRVLPSNTLDATPDRLLPKPPGLMEGVQMVPVSKFDIRDLQPAPDVQGTVSPGVEMVQPVYEVEPGTFRVGEPIATIPELHKKRVTAADIAERLAQANNEANAKIVSAVAPLYENIAEHLAKSQPSMDYLHNPAAIDPSIEVPQPIIPAAIEPQPAVPALVYGNEEERNTAIKQAKVGGMPWKQILSTFKVSAKEASRVLNAV